MAAWVRKKLFGPPRSPAPDPEALEVSAQARELTRTLQPYLNEPDPLATLMTDIFNKREARRDIDASRQDRSSS